LGGIVVTGLSYVNFSLRADFFFKLGEIWVDGCLTFKTCWLM